MSEASAPVPMSGRQQPNRADVITTARLHVLRHPLASNLVTSLRNIDTPAALFENAIHELTRQLLWHATESEPLRSVDVPNFSGQITPGTYFARRLVALLILRAGLSMLPPFRILVPDSPIYQVGIRRDEATLEPRVYYANLPDSFAGVDHVLMLDPMLATGGSARMALKLVRARFKGDISFLGLIGAPIGVKALLSADDHVRVFLASLDERLNDRGYIVPGLGDAGDRLFGTN